jgi:rhodanese-related sulfurtransferase
MTKTVSARKQLLSSFWPLLCILSMGCNLMFTSLDWDEVTQLIEQEFPDVPSISAQEAYRRMSAGDNIVFIDVRDPSEFAVSHLPWAQNKTDNIGFKTAVENASSDALIISYCSVGYRSARTLARLRRDMTITNIKNVYNMQGSIFAWANTGFPLYNGDTEVKDVHPYDSTWGTLLNRDLWAYESSLLVSP